MHYEKCLNVFLLVKFRYFVVRHLRADHAELGHHMHHDRLGVRQFPLWYSL